MIGFKTCFRLGKESLVRASLCLMVGLSVDALAQDETWSSTHIELLSGGKDVYDFNTQDFDTQSDTITLEHSSTWAYGDNYFFVDIYSDETSQGETSSVYGEYYTSLSFSKLLGQNLREGLIQDVSVQLGINTGDDFQAFTYGLKTSFNIPGFSYASLAISAYDDARGVVHREGADLTYQVTPVWGVPFEIGDSKWLFNGFVDFIGERGAGTKNAIVAQPHILFDLGNQLSGNPGQFFVGLEYSWWKNKYGLDIPIERHPQFMIQYQM